MKKLLAVLVLMSGCDQSTPGVKYLALSSDGYELERFRDADAGVTCWKWGHGLSCVRDGR